MIDARSIPIYGAFGERVADPIYQLLEVRCRMNSLIQPTDTVRLRSRMEAERIYRVGAEKPGDVIDLRGYDEDCLESLAYDDRFVSELGSGQTNVVTTTKRPDVGKSRAPAIRLDALLATQRIELSDLYLPAMAGRPLPSRSTASRFAVRSVRYRRGCHSPRSGGANHGCDRCRCAS